MIPTNDCQVKPDPAAARTFLDLLFHGAPPEAWLLVWTNPGKRSAWFQVGGLDGAARYAAAQNVNTYVGVALTSQDYGPGCRIKADAGRPAHGIMGLWLDIDIRGPAHKAQDLPATQTEVIELAGSLGIVPTVTVHSGHGLQLWWLFNEPWIFANDEERSQAAELSEKWVSAFRRRAKAHGWTLDGVHDLARVMRIPGTVNTKSLSDGTTLPLVLARILEHDDGARYTPDDIRLLLDGDAEDQAGEPEPLPAPAPESPRPRAGPPRDERDERVEWARRYVERMPAAVSGQRGHDATFQVAQVLLIGFDLTDSEAWPIMQDYSARCQPPWSEKELRHKFESARAKSKLPIGWILRRQRQSTAREPRSPPPSDQGRPEEPAGDHREPHAAPVTCLANYSEIEAKDEKGKPTTIKVGKSVGAIGADLTRLTGGWPKRVDSLVFVPGNDHAPLWLLGPEALFGWAGRQLAGEAQSNPIHWTGGSDKVTQGQFFAHLTQVAEAYLAVEAYPHEPRLPRHYYMHPEVHGGNGQALQKLLDRFNPETLVDHDLILAFFLTLFWGGTPGQRPAWLVTTEQEGDRLGGRGSGKSMLAKMGGYLSGGIIQASARDEMSKLVTRLLTPSARTQRIVLIDNIKSLKFSWGELEALITQDTISGHQMYTGEGQRPNTLTWCLTINGGSMSRDMAQRVIPIKVKRPEYGAGWEDETRALIEKERWAIIGDCLARLRSAGTKLDHYSRWGAWEAGVLSKVAEPSECQQVIRERQGAIDDDAEESALVREAFRAELERRLHNPDTEAVWIPSKVAAVILSDATGEKFATNRASTFLGTLNVPELRKSNQTNRGWAWRGLKSEPGEALRKILDPPESGLFNQR